MNCNKCNSPMEIRSGRYGKFWGCTGYPGCKNIVKYTSATVEKVEKRQPETPKNWSIFQKEIFKFVESCNSNPGHAVVEAVAGSGKTTTIVEALKYTPTDKSVAFLAFNAHIARELQSRVPDHVHASTLHSLGMKNIRRVHPRLNVDDKKSWKIVNEYGKSQPKIADDLKTVGSDIVKIVSLLKAILLDPTTENIDLICDTFSIDSNGLMPLTVEYSKKVYTESVKQISDGVIDFDDMIFASATGMVACEQFDYIFGDEVQDWNRSQIEFVMKSIKPDGHIIAVGDRYQSIYGFRGADVGAIPNIILALGAKTLPLSISYRCPKSHVKLAQQIVPHIEHADTAIEGTIQTIASEQLISTVKENDLVLCRTNAPLVGPAFELIRNGIKAIIKGREIGDGLINLIAKVCKRTGAQTIENLVEALETHRDNEIQKLTRRQKFAQAQTIDDQVETIFAISEGCSTIVEINERISKIFSDTNSGVTFSSVHKAKGLEAENIFILHPELMPHPMAKSEESKSQEANLMYVAYTRSKNTLTFVV